MESKKQTHVDESKAETRIDSAPPIKGLVLDSETEMITKNHKVVKGSLQIGMRNTRPLHAKTSNEFNKINNDSALSSFPNDMFIVNNQIPEIEELRNQKKRPFRLAPIKKFKNRADSIISPKHFMTIYASPVTNLCERSTTQTKIEKSPRRNLLKRTRKSPAALERSHLKIDDQITISKTFNSQCAISAIEHESQDIQPDQETTIRVENDKGINISSYRQQSIVSNASDLNLISVVRQKQKIEEDVSRLHNRVRLLINEEKKALKMIQLTRDKAENILKIKIEQQEFRKKLVSIKEQQQKEEVRKRSMPSIDTMTTTRSRISEINTRKYEEVDRFKQELSDALRKKRKDEKRSLKDKQMKREDQLCIEASLKDRLENQIERKAQKVRKVKECFIKEQMQQIHRKNSEARSLVKEEFKVLKRLKKTQNLQQDTITHIQELFKSLNDEVHKPALNKFDLNQNSNLFDSSFGLQGVMEDESESIKSPRQQK